MKSRSSKEGVADNFNELRFEDKKGSEEVYVHAEKDFNCVIENNETRKIGLDKKGKGNQTTEIQNDRTTTLNEGKDILTVSSGDYELDITKGKATITAGTSIELKVGSSSIKLDQKSITITGLKVEITANTTLDASSPKTTVGTICGVLKLIGAKIDIN